MIDRATRRVAAAGLDEQIALRLVEPGPLPLDDASVDVVFSNLLLPWVGDPASVAAEVGRVLKVLVESSSDDAPVSLGSRGKLAVHAHVVLLELLELLVCDWLVKGDLVQ